MLGEKLGEASGKMVGMRVLPPDGHGPKVEVSFQGSGKVLGAEVTDIGTYWQTARPDGSLYGEGNVLLMTTGGEIAEWKGFGVGKPTGAGFKASFAVCGSFQAVPERFGRLTSIATVLEYEVDEQGAYRWRMSEWKPAG